MQACQCGAVIDALDRTMGGTSGRQGAKVCRAFVVAPTHLVAKQSDSRGDVGRPAFRYSIRPSGKEPKRLTGVEKGEV